MALKSTGFWNVMQESGEWHRVASITTGTARREAVTKCGYNIPFPSEDVAFSENIGNPTPDLKCQECY